MASAFAVPEIAVQQPIGNSLTDGSTNIDFGNVALSGSRDLTFTILNAGDTDLTGLQITIDGVHASDFSVTTSPSAPVAGTGSTIFTVRFAPGATGARSAALHLASNDGDENPFDLSFAGQGLTPLQVAQQAYLKASNTEPEGNGETGDEFGASVAVSGNTVVVGAAWEASSATGVNGNQSDNSAFTSGAVYVFVRNGTTWTQQAYLKASNSEGGDFFGWSVAISGDTVVVGARDEDSSATGVNGNQSDNNAAFSGAAYVFVRSGTTWSQQAYLKASNTEQFDGFGGSVAVSGDTVVVGADGEDSSAIGVNGNQSDNSASGAGAAYVFVRNGTTWSQQAYLKASNTEEFDGFGLSAAVSGDTVVVGAESEASSATGVNGDQSDNSAGRAGAAYVFVRNGTTWSQQAYLKASNTEPEGDVESGDEFGGSVTVSGNTVVVGASREASSASGVNGNQSDNSAFASGAVYVFVRNGTTWRQEAYLKASNTEEFDGFGGSVAVSGDTLVVGARDEASSATGVNGNQSDNNAIGAGAAYVFVRNGTTWSQQAYLKASNTGGSDAFGGSVAVSGDTVVVGADGEDSSAIGVNGNQSDNSSSLAGAAYTFLTVAPPPASEIAVEQPSGTDLTDGSATVDFGPAVVGSNSQRTFTIRNTGNADLTGLGITIDGANAGDFSVTANPTAPVSGPQGSTTFTVTFTPTASGTRNAALHIASNDADENPFDIALTGTGLAPEIVVQLATGSNLVDGTASVAFGSVAVGSSSESSFIVRNTGNADLTGLGITIDGANASDFSVSLNPVAPVSGPEGSTTFRVTFAPTASGARTAALHIASNDADENPFDIVLTGTGLAPEIVVEQPSGTNLVDGGATVTFGAVLLGGNSARTFAIRNTGSADLTGLGITIDGANANDFSVTANPTAPVSGPTGSTTFTVTFTPAATGTRTAVLHIASNDADENPFDIALTGSGLAPEIVVEQPAGTNLVDGTATVTFGAVLLGSNSARLFTIRNPGSADLTGLGITVDGANANDFSVTANPTAPVSGPNGSTTFTVTFAPVATGTRTAVLHIASNDADENPFDIALTGSGLAPEIAVEQPSGSNLVDGDAAVTFGAVLLGGNSARTFTIRNTGSADLTGLGITVDGANANDFSVTANPTAPVAGPNGSTTFTVTFTPAATGTRTAALHVASNDADENPFDIALTGSGLAPEIVVEQPAETNLVDGSATVTFGAVQLSSNSARLFTIRNTGSADLTGLGITIDGANASDFSVTAGPTAPVSGPTGSTTFTVTFTPAATGTRAAALHIASNDADENPFDISLTGSGLAPEIVVEQPSGTNLVDGSAAVTFGAVQLSSNSARLFTIRNTGSADLTGLGITIEGANASDFSVTANPTAPVSGPTGSTTFTVTFTPTATGTRTAALHLASNDADENPFDISLTGSGLAPEIVVEQPAGTNLVDGSDNVAFGSVRIGESSARTFAIRNTGDADLTGLGITIDGANASDFSVTANPTAPVSGPNGSTTLTVTFTPAATGTRTAALHVASNDADEDPFDIALTGSAFLAPEIVVEQPSGANLVGGTASVLFGNVALGSTAARTFVIRNVGNANLTGLDITINGANASDFNLTTTPFAPVSGPTGSTAFVVTFTPGAAGTRTAALQIASNDADENPFDVSLTGGLSAGDVWRQAFFGSPDPTGDAADLADPDRDGLPNLLEFATAQSPTQFSTQPVSVTLTPGFLEFTYSRSKAALAEIEFTVESSDFLDGPWSAVRVSESILGDDGAVQQVRVTVPQGPNGQRFMRLRVAR